MTKIRSFLFAGALALTSLSIAYAKSYNIEIQNTKTAGKVQLKPGTYTLTVEGSNAVFTSTKNGESYTAPVKLDNGTKKFKDTIMDFTGEQIRYIELAGSTTTLQFVD